MLLEIDFRVCGGTFRREKPKVFRLDIVPLKSGADNISDNCTQHSYHLFSITDPFAMRSAEYAARYFSI